MSQEHDNPSLTTPVAILILAVFLSAALVFVGVEISGLGNAENNLAQALGKQSHVSTAMPSIAGAVPASHTLPAASPFNQANLNTNLANDHVLGPADAPIALITYMDFQCPYCKKFYPVAKQFVEANKGKVKFIIRQYPLPMHKQADFLANVSECVAQQKGNAGFWDFADRVLLTPQFDYSSEAFIAPVLATLHLDNAKYEDCMHTHPFNEKIAAFSAEAHAIGVTGTPTHVLFDVASKKAIYKAGAIPLDQLQAELQTLDH